jgi:hypothetical protein
MCRGSDIKIPDILYFIRFVVIKIDGDKMGLLKKALVYGGVFALGMVAGYKGCVNPNYKVIEEKGKVYVEDKRTGKVAEVDDDFDAEVEAKKRDIGDRIKDAYKSLTK